MVYLESIKKMEGRELNFWKNPRPAFGRRSSWEKFQLQNETLEDDLFVFQSYRGILPKGLRAKFRILLKSNNYVLAHGNDVEQLKKHWDYLHNEIPKLINEIQPQDSSKWILEHISELSKDRKGKNGESEEDEASEEDLSKSSPIQSSPTIIRKSLSNSLLGSKNKRSSSPSSPEEEVQQSEVIEKNGKNGNQEKSSPSWVRRVFKQEKQLDKSKVENLTRFECILRDLQTFFGKIFDENASRDQRTKRYILCSVILVTLYLFIIRVCSWDLYIIMTIGLNMAIIYVIANRRSIVKIIAKKKVKRALGVKHTQLKNISD